MRYIELRGASLVGCQEKPFMGGGVNAALQSKAAEAKKKKKRGKNSGLSSYFWFLGQNFILPPRALAQTGKRLTFSTPCVMRRG